MGQDDTALAPPAPADTARRRLRTLVVATGAVFVAVNVSIALGALRLGPTWESLDVQMILGGTVTAVAAVYAARTSTGASRTVWALVAASLTLDVVGDVWWVLLDLRGRTPYVSPADALYLIAYPLLAAALWIIARSRSGPDGPRSMVDGLVCAVGLGLLAWQVVLVQSGTIDAANGFFHHLVLGSYPMLDLLLLGALTGVLLASATRGAVLRWFTLYVVTFIVADVLYVVASGTDDSLVLWADVAYSLAYMFAGLTALAPDARRIGEVSARPSGAARWRFVMLAAAVVAPAITAAVVVASGADFNVAVLVATTAVLAVLVAWRVAVTVGAEREAREASELAQAELDHLARHDPLTGLPNRLALLDRLDRRTGDVAVLFVDLDRFKQVNDTAGHAFGDAVLREAASRLAASLRPGDVAHRLGGDEFVVVADGVVDEADAVVLAERLVDAVTEPFRSGSVEWYLGASVGVALAAAPDDPSATPFDAERLLRMADTAMFHAKRDPHRSVQMFDAVMQEDLEVRHDLEIDIRRGLEAGEFEPAFQPIVHLADGTVAGFEALARWRRPGEGLRPAAEFIDVAEQSGLLPSIDDVVLRRALEFVVRWNDRHPDRAPAYVTVNASATELTSTHLLPRLRSALAAAGADPAVVVLELTEGALVRAPEVAAERLAEVHDLGLRIALDDFGTGFSSLSHLLRFPVDILKIDRSFVEELTGEVGPHSVAAATCRLAETLGLTVVAEGVETEEQADALRGLGVDLVQGYLYSPPLDVGVALGLVQASPVAGTPAAG